MTDYLDLPITACALNGALTDAFRDIVIRRALEHLETASAPTRNALKAVLRKNAKVPGFKDPVRAIHSPKRSIVVSQMISAFAYDATLVSAVLKIWDESHPELHQAVETFLRETDPAFGEPAVITAEFPAVWPIKAIEEITSEFLATYPLFEQDDAALMLCYISGRMPLDYDPNKHPFPDDEFVDDEEPDNVDIIPDQQLAANRIVLPQEVDTMPDISPFLSQVLATIEALPPDAPEWDQIPVFTTHLQAVAEGKLTERNQGRVQLRQAITALAVQAHAALTWWGYDITAWSAERCDWIQAAAVARQVEKWQDMLLRHDALRQAPASNLAEERSRRHAMTGLEEEIEHKYTALSLALTLQSPDPLPGPGGGIETESTTPEEASENAQEAADENSSVIDDDLLTVAHTVELEQLDEPSSAPAVNVEQPAVLALEDGDATVDIADESMAPDDTEVGEELPIRSEESDDTEYLLLDTSTEDDEQLDQEDLTLPPLDIVAISRQTVAIDAEDLLQDDPDIDQTLSPSALEAEVDNDEVWDTLLGSLLAEDDLSGAYWLAKSLHAMQRPSPVPDWLIAAVQASRIVAEDMPGLVRDLFELSSRHHSPEDTPVQSLLGVAAALRSAVVAPTSGMSAWLTPPAICPQLHELIQPIRHFATGNLGLHSEDVRGISGEEQRNEAIVEISREAIRWLEEAPNRRKRVSAVWLLLVGQRGALRDFLQPVCENQWDKLQIVRSNIEIWKDRPTVYARFDDMNIAGYPGRPEHVTGAGKQDLYREVERAVAIAEQWCASVERAKSISVKGDWFRDQITELRSNVESSLPTIDAAMDEFISDRQPVLVASAARVLQKSLIQIRDLLDIPIPQDHSTPIPFSASYTSLGADSLDAVLCARLLWLPEVPLTENGRPTEASIPTIARAIRSAHNDRRTLDQAARRWLQQQDYRFVDKLIASLDNPDLVRNFQQDYNEALLASRATLNAAIKDLGNQVEQSLLNEAITEEQRSHYAAAFESLAVEEVRDFRSVLTNLEKIRKEIRQAHRNRLKYLQDQHHLISQRLNTSHIPLKQQNEALSFVDAALKRHDVRVAVESMARLQEVLDTGDDLRSDWYAPASDRDYLEEFNAASQRIESWLDEHRGGLRVLATAARDGTTRAGVQFGALTEPRRKEAQEALMAWRALKQQAPTGNNVPLISSILRYMGFDLKTGSAAPIDLANTGADWLHARVSMSAGDLVRPIPEFGSQAHGNYDVICLWERPGADTIAARLRSLHLDIHTVIVLYLGRITARQKRDVIRVSRDRHLAIAVLDETLLIYLAQERNTRLPTFLRCALPFSALNPYRPFQAGDVPPEMFFGRETMARELIKQGGSCLVYGGRQLGKSALLRHVERQFHRPAQQQFAWVENMKLVFDPAAGKTAKNLWRSLREQFKAHQLFAGAVRTETPELIAQHIVEAMQARPHQRVIVMLDEADDFLDADAKEGFRTVIALRDLMGNTGQRFKVIFAGLQSVQRFQGIPNQPLAHFGTPICVGPLEPGEAQQLVRQPLEALGFRFVDDGAVLRVLSYTNYHPGLIQYFCQELLKKLRESTVTFLPPYLIRQQNIEAVYRTQTVRDRIRERFEWTVALDMHYQAIAWTLIHDQAKDRDGYARAYAPSHVLQLVRDWWPAGFGDTGTDQLRGWLDELCGLGVLVRNNATGHYRLRSPNMVRLLGRETDIEDRLLELTAKSPTLAMEADSHHAPLNEQATLYSPLTYAEERRLSQPRYGVGIVVASQALGSMWLPAAIRRFLPDDLSPGIGDCTEIPVSVAPAELDHWLREYVKAQSRTERMILYQQMADGTPEAMAKRIESALSFCQRQQPKDRWLRVLFLLDHRANWHWLGLPTQRRMEIEEASDAALWCHPWSLSAIRRRLAQHEKMDPNDATMSQEVLSATGGWPYLLDALFRRAEKENDLRPCLREIAQELTTPDSILVTEFRSQLGKNAIAQRVLNFVLSTGQGWLEEEYLTPDLIGGHPELTVAQCAQAIEYLERLSLIERKNETLIVNPIVAQVMSPS